MLAVGPDSQSSGHTPFVRVYTLGNFRVLVGERPIDDGVWRRKTARQLFKVLLTRPGRRMARDEVIELFWPESDADAAASNFRSTLHAMRRALALKTTDHPTGVIFGDHDSVWLGSNAELWTDASVFEQKVAEASRSPDPLPLLEEASALYAGDYLPDDLYDDWAAERREALRRTWTELQFALARAQEMQGDVNAAQQPLERLLRADPCDERAALELMKLLTRNGRRSEAVRVYQRLRQSLREELSVEPSPQSADLFRQIGAGEAVPAPSIPSASFRCSYPFPAPSELVGRDAELATLSQVLAGGRTAGRVAFIAAPAGTGKSALLGHIVRQAQAQGILCLAGGCYEERGAVPLGPFHDALVDYVLAQPAENIRAQIGGLVKDLARIVPELAYHLELSAAPAAADVDRMRAFGAVHAFLRGLAERGPMLLCLEDLHAADEATMQLLHYLARQTRRLPIVIFATYRSDEARAEEVLAQTAAAMQRERLAQRVLLNPLSRDETERLVARLLDASPSEALGSSVYATTGGNPLFVEQLVLALGETGQLELRGNVWHATGDLQGTPQIVREIIAQRLHRLNSTCREVLAMASVLGQAFEHKVLLAAVEPLQESQLLDAVDSAITAQILQDASGGYAFRHALVRESVYWDLSAARRMRLHARAGELLEQFYGARADDYASQLAHQFALAGESSQVRQKALRYSVVAGRRALQLSSSAESLTHFQRAWEIIQADAIEAGTQLQADVLSGRGLAESNLARYSESVSTLRAAIELSRDPIQRGRARKVIAHCFHQEGALDSMVEECNAGLQEVGELPGADAAEIRATLKQLLAAALYYRGHFTEVVQLGREIEREVVGAGDGPRLLAHWVLGWGYMGLGQVRPALDQYQLAVSEGERWGDKVLLATCYENLSQQEYLGGQFAAAREHLATSLSLYRESASELRAANALHILCRVWIADGEHLRASGQIVRALELQHGEETRLLAAAHFLQGTIQLLRGEWVAARDSFEKSLRIERRAGVVPWSVEALVALGRVAQYSGDWEQAFGHYREALSLAQQMDACPQRVLAERHLGQLYRMAGSPNQAETHLAAALAMAETMSETLEYAPTLLSMAELQNDLNQAGSALALAQKALDAARPLEQRVDAHIVLAGLLLSSGDVAGASSHATDAMTGAQQLGSPRHQSLAHLALARATADKRS